MNMIPTLLLELEMQKDRTKRRARLEALVASGSAEARDAVAQVMSANQSRELQDDLLDTLRSLAQAGNSNLAYEVWLVTRHPRLTAALTEEGWIPDFAFHLKVFHALEFGKLHDIIHGGPEVVNPLVAATRGPNPQTRALAVRCLESLHDPDAVDALCRQWIERRNALLEQVIKDKGHVARRPAAVRVLTALLCDRRDLVEEAGEDVAEPLIAASSDRDAALAHRAMKWLAHLKNPEAVDALSAIWAHQRAPELARVIREAGYVAAKPATVRALSALQSGRTDLIALDGPEIIPGLAAAAEDSDRLISAAARKLLDRVLGTQEAQDALCRFAIEHGSTLALDIARARTFRPRDLRDAALLYFLSEQWGEYESLDFDMSILKEAYEHGGRKLRERIARRARQAGRLELVELVSGMRHKRQMGQMTIREWEVTLGILEDRRDWETMWRLAQTAPAVWAVAALKRLEELGWSPQNGNEGTGFTHLVQLARACTTDAPILGMVDRPTAQFQAHGRRVTALLVSSYFDRTLASASWDGTVRVWRMPDGELLTTLAAHRHPVTCLAATADGSTLASGSGAEPWVSLWSMPDGELVRRLDGHRRGVACLDTSPDSRLLVAGGHDGVCRVWRLRDAALVSMLQGHEESVRCAAFSPDGTILATGGEDHTVRLWTPRDGRLLATLSEHSLTVRCLAFAPNGAILASGSSDDDIVLWGIPGGQLLKRLKGHTDRVYSLAMSGDGRVLASGSWDKTVRLWIMPEGTPWGTLEERPAPVTCLATDPESRMLVSGSHDCSVTLWNFQSGAFRRPTTREDMERIERLSRSAADEGERQWLDFLLAQMKWRWRFDIEVEQGPARIEVGEFDIEIT